MSRFRGTMKGNAGLVARLGTKKSGLKVTCAGWDGSVTVEATVDDDGNDRFIVSSSKIGMICVLDENGSYTSSSWRKIE